MYRTTWICLTVLSLIIAGCAKPADDKKKSTPTADTKTADAGKAKDTAKAPDTKTPDTKTPDKTPDTKTPDVTKTPDTPKAPVSKDGPDKAVLDVVNGIADGKPIVLWDSLPASYQKDIKGLISDFAGKMDKDLWNKGFAVARKAVDVLKKQKELIIAQLAPFIPPTINKDKLSQNWDGMVDVLGTIVNSELSNLDDLKKANVEGWLNGTVAKVMKQSQALGQVIDPAQFVPGAASITELPALAKKTKVTIVKMEGDKATLKIENEDPKFKDKPEEAAFVKVEGKWIPKDMADNWAKGLADAKKGLDQIKQEEISKMKPQVMAMMDMAEQKLDALAKAKNAEEFQKIIQEAIAGFSGGK